MGAKSILAYVLAETMTWAHIPVQDETAPTIEQIQQFIELILNARQAKTVRCMLHLQLLSHKSVSFNKFATTVIKTTCNILLL